MKILFTGGSGFVGGVTVQHLLSDRHYRLALTQRDSPLPCLNSPSLTTLNIPDLCDLDGRAKYFQQCSCMVHMAALSTPDICHASPDAVEQVNVESTRHLVAIASSLRIPLIFTSTDLVYEGALATPTGFSEEDPVVPITRYAQSKVAAEQLVLGHSQGTVLRLSLVYGISCTSKPGMLGWMMSRFKNREQLELFEDEWRTPILADDVARTISFLIQHPQPGLFHLGGPERVSRLAIGQRVAEVFGYDKALIRPTQRSSFRGGYERAPDVSLDSRRIQEILPFKILTIQEGLEALSGRDMAKAARAQ